MGAALQIAAPTNQKGTTAMTDSLTSVTELPLWDDDVPLIGSTFNIDEPRTRRHDPLPSHVAADKSATNRAAVKTAILELVHILGHADGNQLNTSYQLLQNKYGWPVVASESPRKRAGELAADGLLIILNPTDPRGTPAIYSLPGGTK